MSIRVYAQKKKDGGEYFFTNVKTNLPIVEGEEQKTIWSKLYIVFPRDKEPMLGSITVKDFGLGADIVIKDEEKGIKDTYFKMFLRDYEKTEKDLEDDNDYIASGKTFIREYHEYKKKEETQDNYANNLHSNLVEFTKPNELPF